MMAEIFFIGSLLTILYIYIGYPLLALLLSKTLNKHTQKGFYEPDVTILIAAYNEDKNIRRTIENKIGLNYPAEKLEIIIVSDGSTDTTDDIVKEYREQKVRLLRQEPRAGKTAALNLAAQQAKGEMLVFSDANSIYEKDALNYLLQNFADPEVGYVTGRMVYADPDGTLIGNGCSAYMKYENFLRNLETKISSVIGVDGGIDAVRKSLYQQMRPDQLPDFILPLKVVEQGCRVVYEPLAILREPSLQSTRDEYKMRVRVSLRALWALWDMKHLLDARKFKVFSLELFSHKHLRYMAFIFLLFLYFSNLSLWNEGIFYSVFFIMQNIFYGAAVISLVLEKAGRHLKILYVPSYFTLLNMASAHAFMKFLAGQKQVVWIPRKG